MSILTKMANLKKASGTSARVAMTDEQVKLCKEAIRNKNRGYNVQPNRFDISMPYRVAINYDEKWSNFGNFSDADVAAAIGSIVSAAFFGEKAVAGEFDAEVVETHPEFTAWMADARNAEVIAKAESDEAPTASEDNPF